MSKKRGLDKIRDLGEPRHTPGPKKYGQRADHPYQIETRSTTRGRPIPVPDTATSREAQTDDFRRVSQFFNRLSNVAPEPTDDQLVSRLQTIPPLLPNQSTVSAEDLNATLRGIFDIENDISSPPIQRISPIILQRSSGWNILRPSILNQAANQSQSSANEQPIFRPLQEALSAQQSNYPPENRAPSPVPLFAHLFEPHSSNSNADPQQPPLRPQGQPVEPPVGQEQPLNNPHDEAFIFDDINENLNEMAQIGDYIALIPDFDGSYRGLNSYIRFMDRVWGHTEIFTAQERLRFSISAQSKLKGEAANYLAELNEDSWPSLRQLLLRKIRPTVSIEVASMELQKATQGPKESLQEFIERIQKLLKELNAMYSDENPNVQAFVSAENEKKAKKALENGVSNPKIKERLATANIDTFDAAIDYVKLQEFRISETKPSSDISIRCSYCNIQGHAIIDCRRKFKDEYGVLFQERCFMCNETTHKQNKCPHLLAFGYTNAVQRRNLLSPQQSPRRFENSGFNRYSPPRPTSNNNMSFNRPWNNGSSSSRPWNRSPSYDRPWNNGSSYNRTNNTQNSGFSFNRPWNGNFQNNGQYRNNNAYNGQSQRPQYLPNNSYNNYNRNQYGNNNEAPAQRFSNTNVAPNNAAPYAPGNNNVNGGNFRQVRHSGVVPAHAIRAQAHSIPRGN